MSRAKSTVRPTCSFVTEVTADDWYPVYTIQPVVKPLKPATGLRTVLNEQPLFVRFNRLSNRVVQPVWQQVVSCKRGLMINLLCIRTIRGVSKMSLLCQAISLIYCHSMLDEEQPLFWHFLSNISRAYMYSRSFWQRIVVHLWPDDILKCVSCVFGKTACSI